MTDHSALAAEVEAFSGVRVLCVGDVMLDRFAYGEVERISPEAPIPVFRHRYEAAMAGGAGNVLRNLSTLGVASRIVAVIGDDDAGSELRALIEAEEGAQAELFVAKGRETTIKTRYIAGSQQLLRADRETTTDIEPEIAEKIVAAVAAALADAAEVDAIVLSDYGKGVLTPEVTGRIIEAARKAGKPVVVDPKGPDMSHYRGASVVTPNRRELAEASGLAVSDDAEIIIAAEKLIAGCGIEAVLVTRAKDGMTLVTNAGAEHLGAMKREVFDVSGAGDTVVATLAAAIGAGVALADAAAIANAAAGVVVGKVGTAVAGKSELIDALHGRERSGAGSKLASFEAAIEHIARWRRKGLRIGFTNGCFDLLHPGHVSLFEQARGACDRLVVGLNSDASVTRFKGEGRPIQDAAARAAVLGSVASVDLVVVFADDTPVKLIEAIRPDILIKGADWAIEEVVGADFVRSYGGRVLLVEIAPGHGTTQTIARMVK